METKSSPVAPILLVLICIALAAATVYAVKTSYDLRFELKQRDATLEQLRSEKPKSSSLARLGALQRQLSETEALSRDLREQNDQLRRRLETQAPPRVAVVLATNAPARSSSTNRVSWLERMQQENPERYKQIMEEREQRRQRVDAFMKEQFTRLDERLQTAQTQEEADLINQLTDTLQKADELRLKWEEVRQLPEAQRAEHAQELRAESWQIYQTLGQLRAQDRKIQLEQVARDLGYRDPKDVQAFVDSLDRIYTETDMSMNRWMGFGRGGGRRGEQNSQ